jgi:hypothetical protein
MITRRVSARIRRRTSSGSVRPKPSQGAASTSTPSIRRSGRSTALCSNEETTTWSPGRTWPRIAMLSDQVAPGVSAQHSGSARPVKRHSPSRRDSATLAFSAAAA